MSDGLTALGAWATARAKDYEVVAQSRDADGPMVDRALDIVRRFIIDRDLILFGGLAIDYALRLRGSRIYPDDERPDFDFLSPRSVDDAYDLADILVKAGFEGIGAVRGIHVQTMKVRTDFIWVADIGYAPKEAFDRIPTLQWKGMRFAHPDYQRMDQHLAFCFPFNGPPREDVFHRWKKDLKRFNLFEEHYPITHGDISSATKLVTATAAEPLTGPAKELKAALHGFAAYAIIRSALDEMAAAFGVKAECSAPRLKIEFPSERSVTVEMPEGMTTVYLASPEPAAMIEGLQPGPQWLEPYMDLSPESVRAGSLEVLSTRGRLLAASVVSVLVAGAKSQAFVVSPQYLLLHFLFESQRAPPATKDVYRAYYCHTLDVIRAAEAVIVGKMDAAGAAPTNAALAQLPELFGCSPFAPVTSTLGTINHDAAYIVKMATNAEKLHEQPPPALGLDPNITKLLVGLPQNYYPGGNKVRPTFDYEASALFRRAGRPLATRS